MRLLFFVLSVVLKIELFVKIVMSSINLIFVLRINVLLTFIEKSYV